MSSRDAQSPRRMESRRVRGPAQGGARTGLAYEAKRDRRSPPSVPSWRKVRTEEGNGGGRGKERTLSWVGLYVRGRKLTELSGWEADRELVDAGTELWRSR